MTNFVTRFKDNYAYLEIVGDESDKNQYFVEFIDLNTNITEYSNTIFVNYWSKLDNTHNKNITIKVTTSDGVVFERNQNQKFNRVYIKICSNSLGDNIAWLPCIDEYRKLNNVEVLVYSNHKNIFDYPELTFVDISNPDYINDVDKKFKIDNGHELNFSNGKPASELWFEENKKYNNCVESIDYRKYSLQSVACLMLGIPDQEYIPKVKIPDSGPKIKGKYVVVAIQSTAQLKYWNNPFGWERVFDFLNRNEYKVVLIDKNRNFGISGHFNQAPKSKNLIDKTGNYPLSDRIIDIKYADMMITISSGLAWLSWAVGTPVVMISGFTKPFVEFKSNCIRIHNSNVCNGCWNDPNLTFDASNWLYCPRNQDFICSKAIQPKDVIESVKKLMK